jgi:Protein of unknown function (DUF2934)
MRDTTSEEQIRFRAYQLWEMAGRPFVDDDRFWREAEAELEFLHARDDMRDHHWNGSASQIIAGPQSSSVRWVMQDILPLAVDLHVHSFDLASDVVEVWHVGGPWYGRRTMNKPRT